MNHSNLWARALGVSFGVMLSIPAMGQVFVRTILDRSQAEPQQKTWARLGPQEKGENAKKGVDEIEKKIEGLLEQLEKGDIDPKTFDDGVKKVCDDNGSALTNRKAPVAWSSARSACFWHQPSLDFAHAAQIVGGDNQGTASVEIVSDVFWGLRVRVQSSVTGTDSTEADAQAKAILKQVQTSGGNFSVGATYPWYALEKSHARVQGMFTSFVRVGGAVPALGNSSNSATIKASDANGSLELALLDSLIQFQSFRRSINFVLTGRGSVVNGTHTFNETIKNTGHRGYAYGQIGAGLRFADSVWLVASRTYYSHNLPGSGMTYSVLFGK